MEPLHDLGFGGDWRCGPDHRALLSSDQVQAVGEEMARLSTPKLVELARLGLAADETRRRSFRISLDTLHAIRDDPERDPEFRETVAVFAETFAKRMPDDA